jgi:hypothetical protein
MSKKANKKELINFAGKHEVLAKMAALFILSEIEGKSILEKATILEAALLSFALTVKHGKK